MTRDEFDRNQTGSMGSEPDTTNGTGAAYLRSLKETEPTKAAPAPPAVAPAAPPRERRRSVRYRCHGSAEFRTEGTEVRTWGTLADVSMHGCYVEMTATYPVGTVVELGLEAAGVRVHATGEVKVSYPFLGMGISFNEFAPEEKEQLRSMLGRLSAQAQPVTPARDVVGSDGIPIALPTFASAGELVKELAHFFEGHSALSREEFHKMLGRWPESR